MSLPALRESFTRDGYEFRNVDPRDVKLIRSWLAEPHIADWWSPSGEEMAHLRADMDDPKANTRRFIVSLKERDFAYIQCYDPALDNDFWGDHPQPPGTLGLDQFIGDSQMIGFGHGARFIRAFIDELRTFPDVTRLIVDPDPENTHAIHCYAQAGFRKEREIFTPDGPAALMSLPLAHDHP